MKADEPNILKSEGVIDAYKTYAEYRVNFRIGEIDSQTVRFRISEGTDRRFYFDQSHYIHTPEQNGPYLASRRVENTPEGALRLAMDSIARFYNGAVNAGHKPTDDWFTPNDFYDERG